MTYEEDGIYSFKIIKANKPTVAVYINATSARVVEEAPTVILAIGDSYQGGKIAYLDGTGQHGFVAATSVQSTGVQGRGCLARCG